jgi:phage tail-like protein
MSDPYTGFRFVVTLDMADFHLPAAQIATVPPIIVGGFQEVSGLGAELEVSAYPEGGENDHTHQLPVRHTWNRITLSRGITSDIRLYAWYLSGMYQSLGARRNGVITLLSEDGTPAVAWIFHGGIATKWNGPAFKSEEGSVAIESLEIAHEGILQIPLTNPIPVSP